MINGQVTNVQVWNPEWAKWQSAPGSIRVDEAIQTKLVIQNTGNETALYGCFLMYIDPYGTPRDSFMLPPEGGSIPLNPGEIYESPVMAGGMYGTAIYPGQWTANIRLFVWNDLNPVIEVPSSLVIANVLSGPDRNIAQIVNIEYLRSNQYQSTPPSVVMGETIGFRATIKNVSNSSIDVVGDLKLINPDGTLIDMPPNPPGFWQWRLNAGEQVSFSGVCSAQQNGQYWAWIEVKGNYTGWTPSLVLDQQTVVIAQVGAAPPPSPVAPVINSFIATPAGINSGESSVLSWDVSGATGISIDQGIGDVIAAGSVEVSPAVTTIYTLTASNAAGIVTSAVIVTVGATPPPETPAVTPSNTPLLVMSLVLISVAAVGIIISAAKRKRG